MENTKDYLPLANQLQKLVSPAEMGELFKVIAFGKNIHQPLIGFSSGDKSRMLSACALARNAAIANNSGYLVRKPSALFEVQKQPPGFSPCML